MDWQLADAKNRFSELVTRALSKGPQRVRRRKDSVIVVNEKEYQRLKGKPRGFKEWLLNGPAISKLDLARDKSPMRTTDL